MIDTVFGIKARMSGLSINRYRPIGHCLIGASLAVCIEFSVLSMPVSLYREFFVNQKNPPVVF